MLTPMVGRAAPAYWRRSPHPESHHPRHTAKIEGASAGDAICEGHTQRALVMNKQHTLALIYTRAEHFGPNPLRLKVHHLAVERMPSLIGTPKRARDKRRDPAQHMGKIQHLVTSARILQFHARI
jgi:hypothetical protein